MYLTREGSTVRKDALFEDALFEERGTPRERSSPFVPGEGYRIFWVERRTFFNDEGRRFNN